MSDQLTIRPPPGMTCDQFRALLAATFPSAVVVDYPALQSVLDERQRQNAKWGVQNHDGFVWIAILGEELGELSQAVLETKFGGKHGGMENVRAEAVQCAAVALQIVECIDRNGGI